MINPIFKLDTPEKFTEQEKKRFCELLIMQDKVVNPTIAKLNRCQFLCVCVINKEIVSVGAIKPKTKSDFNKSGLEKLSDKFQLELGYCYTLDDHTKKGYSSEIVKQLLQNNIKQNLMASTELREDNPMIRILEKNGFKQFGKSWNSAIHAGSLGLFLRIVNNELVDQNSEP